MQISEQNKRIKELEAELKDFNAAYDVRSIVRLIIPKLDRVLLPLDCEK